MSSRTRRRAGVAIVTATLALAGPASAAGAPPAQSGTPALLDVPYLPQTPELCGGAAVAMVLRYWGERDVFPEDFAPLVSEGDGGILTDALASSVRDMGWQAFVLPADEDSHRERLRSEVDNGRPLIALIEVDQQNRDVLLTVLHRSDVTELASRLGLSLTRAEDAIATLDSVELARLAGQARTTTHCCSSSSSSSSSPASTSVVQDDAQ